MNRYEAFQAYRSKMNCRILGDDAQRRSCAGVSEGGTPPVGATIVTKRFFSLDHQTYQAGALSAKTKELLGLAASMVLRCDDCIAYHIDQCVQAGVTDEELWETFDVALIVGGSIVIPHLRRGVEFLDQARAAMTTPGGACAS
ncbi:MAG: alkyl hydroperoxide reductase AhpD [Phycisphaerae bacterium]|nr:MAG: alkyl hydroperoxide reductase AhpD [Phycisphaerae bacterium]